MVAATPAAAQSGFAFDSEAGIFRPVPQVTVDAAQRAAALRQGRYEIEIVVNLKSAPTGDTKPLCAAHISHFGAAGISYQEQATTIATGAGLKWTCKLVVPYLWAQAETNAPVILGITATSGIETGNSRMHYRSLAPAKLPANNAVTKLNYNVTL